MCICGTTKAYSRLALRSAATWTFIMAGVHTRALTAPRPIKPTSPRCHSAWQPNPGRGSTYRRGKSVQTTGATSLSTISAFAELSDSDQAQIVRLIQDFSSRRWWDAWWERAYWSAQIGLLFIGVG